MGWFGRGIGDLGSQIGEGYDINQAWKQRAQNMAIENARQKITQMMAPLQLTELQQRIKQMQNPQAAGIERLPGGGLSGVTFRDGVYSLQNLAPGAPPEPKFSSLQQAAAYYLQKGDFEKLKTVNDEIEKTKTPKTEKPTTEIFGNARWQWDPEKKIQGQRDPTGQYVRLGVAKEPGNERPQTEWEQRIANYIAANGMKDTPANRDKADQALGTRNKQNDRSDAIKSVQTVMNAQKSLQSLETGIQKSNKTFSVWNPRTWGNDPALTAITKQATDDYQQKAQDAIAKLTDAGMPVPAWLTQNAGGPQDVPPPPGPPPGRTGKISVQ